MPAPPPQITAREREDLYRQIHSKKGELEDKMRSAIAELQALKRRVYQKDRNVELGHIAKGGVATSGCAMTTAALVVGTGGAALVPLGITAICCFATSFLTGVSTSAADAAYGRKYRLQLQNIANLVLAAKVSLTFAIVHYLQNTIRVTKPKGLYEAAWGATSLANEIKEHYSIIFKVLFPDDKERKLLIMDHLENIVSIPAIPGYSYARNGIVGGLGKLESELVDKMVQGFEHLETGAIQVAETVGDILGETALAPIFLGYHAINTTRLIWKRTGSSSHTPSQLEKEVDQVLVKFEKERSSLATQPLNLPRPSSVSSSCSPSSTLAFKKAGRHGKLSRKDRMGCANRGYVCGRIVSQLVWSFAVLLVVVALMLGLVTVHPDLKDRLVTPVMILGQDWVYEKTLQALPSSVSAWSPPFLPSSKGTRPQRDDAEPEPLLLAPATGSADKKDKKDKQAVAAPAKDDHQMTDEDELKGLASMLERIEKLMFSVYSSSHQPIESQFEPLEQEGDHLAPKKEEDDANKALTQEIRIIAKEEAEDESNSSMFSSFWGSWFRPKEAARPTTGEAQQPQQQHETEQDEDLLSTFGGLGKFLFPTSWAQGEQPQQEGEIQTLAEHSAVDEVQKEVGSLREFALVFGSGAWRGFLHASVIGLVAVFMVEFVRQRLL